MAASICLFTAFEGRGAVASRKSAASQCTSRRSRNRGGEETTPRQRSASRRLLSLGAANTTPQAWCLSHLRCGAATRRRNSWRAGVSASKSWMSTWRVRSCPWRSQRSTCSTSRGTARGGCCSATPCPARPFTATTARTPRTDTRPFQGSIPRSGAPPSCCSTRRSVVGRALGARAAAPRKPPRALLRRLRSGGSESCCSPGAPAATCSPSWLWPVA
mmetsp:Transcript_69403/g.206761  ORF Transcript_69403/g.206761 Transcript_69403/m.206761 type:complete len:217 (+) Transcript_69403:82-732(+)